MTRKSGRTGSTSTASSSSPRDSTATATTTTTNITTPPNKLNKRSNSGGLLLNGDLSPTEKRAPTMTKAPRVNGVAERTSPLKNHHNHHHPHHLHNGSAESLLLENGFHEATTTSPKAPATFTGLRSKRDSSGTTTEEKEKEPMGSPRLVVLNGGDQSMTITGNNSSQKQHNTSYLSSPSNTHNNSSSTTKKSPLYKVIDKSMSYTKSSPLLSPGATAASSNSRLQSQSPTASVPVTDGMRSPGITKSPAEEVKSNRRGQAQLSSPCPPPSSSSSPLKGSSISGTPIKASSRPNTPAGVGRGGKKRTLRKNELSLLNDEAENFMFPKAKEDVDSDSSDVIIIVKGKKKTKAKGSAEEGNSSCASGNVDDQTMALIKSEMGEEEEDSLIATAAGDEEGEGEEEEESVPKAVHLLPLKKRFGMPKGVKTKANEGIVKDTLVIAPVVVETVLAKKKGTAKKKGAKLEAVVQEKLLPVVKQKGKKAVAKGKKGVANVVVKMEVEDEEEVVVKEEPGVKVKQPKRTKKETAKERRKREKLERELSLLIKTESDEGEPEHEPQGEEETYSNLTRIMEAEEVQKFRFAFERVPSMEPWFAAFHRQDEGEERIFEYYGSTKYMKLPYEMGELPPLPQNCCALSHLRGTPTKSPKKGRPAGDCPAKPTRLFTSARISMKRNKLLQEAELTTKPTIAATSRRSLPAAAGQQLPGLPRKRGRPPRVPRRLEEEVEAVQTTTTTTTPREGSVDSDGIELSGKQKAAGTKSLAERKRKLLADLEQPRKSPREHASTLAILSCLLQQRQLNEKEKGDHSVLASEEEMSSERNSETASERRDSACFEAVDVVVKKEIKTEEGEEDEAEAAATTTSDPLEVFPEEMLLPMTPPPVPVPSRTNTPGLQTLKRSNSSMSNRSAGGKRRKTQHGWRARDSINAQELNREIESLLTDPLNASAESIDSKLLDKSDEFLMPFHECPEFCELVLSVDAEDYKQGYVRKSFAVRRQMKVPTNNILQLDYQLRSTKKRKNRTGWPSNKRRTSAAVTQAKKEGPQKETGKRSVSCDVKREVVIEEEEEEEDVDDKEQEGEDDDEEEEVIVEEVDKRSSLSIITDASEGADNHPLKEEDPLQRSPILRKLLSPQWRRSGVTSGEAKELKRGTSSSPNGLRRGKNAATPVSDLLLLDCDESQQSVSSISVIVSDDPDGQMLSSDNTTAGTAQSPSGMRMFKQTTLSRFFSRNKVTATVTNTTTTTAAAFAAAGEEKEKENIEADENGQVVEGEEDDNEDDGMGSQREEEVEEEEDEDLDHQMEVEEVIEEEEEEMEMAEEAHEEEPVRKAAIAEKSRKKNESKLKNGINMNPIISIKKLPTELSKVTVSKGGGGCGGGGGRKVAAPVKAAKRRVNKASGNASIRSKRQRRRKIA